MLSNILLEMLEKTNLAWFLSSLQRLYWEKKQQINGETDLKFIFQVLLLRLWMRYSWKYWSNCYTSESMLLRSISLPNLWIKNKKKAETWLLPKASRRPLVSLWQVFACLSSLMPRTLATNWKLKFLSFYLWTRLILHKRAWRGELRNCALVYLEEWS